MLTEQQVNIICRNLGIATFASFGVTVLLSRTSHYVTGAIVTLVLIAIFAGISYMSGEGDK